MKRMRALRLPSMEMVRKMEDYIQDSRLGRSEKKLHSLKKKFPTR
jgi:hypothetical protein